MKKYKFKNDPSKNVDIKFSLRSLNFTFKNYVVLNIYGIGLKNGFIILALDCIKSKQKIK